MNTLISAEAEERIIAKERLRILAWGFYICGGLGTLLSCFGLIYAVLFGALSFMPEQFMSPPQSSHQTFQAPSASTVSASQGPPATVFRIFSGVALFVVLCGWTLGGLTIYAGRCIQKRQHLIFVYVMACYNLLWIPHGTFLGILAIITLQTPAAKREFDRDID